MKLIDIVLGTKVIPIVAGDAEFRFFRNRFNFNNVLRVGRALDTDPEFSGVDVAVQREGSQVRQHLANLIPGERLYFHIPKGTIIIRGQETKF